MMIVRFLVAVLLAVAFIVVAAVVDVDWLAVLALAAVIVAVLFVVQMVMRYTGAEEWLGPEAEADLARDHLVEHETGLPPTGTGATAACSRPPTTSRPRGRDRTAPIACC